MKNKREFFRVELYYLPITVHSNGRERTGLIRDVSGNGISFTLSENVTMSDATLSFQIEGVAFQFEARLIRQSKNQKGDFTYAMTYVKADEKVQAKLVSLLLRLDAIRRRK